MFIMGTEVIRMKALSGDSLQN
jgi:hypothetical protein